MLHKVVKPVEVIFVFELYLDLILAIRASNSNFGIKRLSKLFCGLTIKLRSWRFFYWVVFSFLAASKQPGKSLGFPH